VTVTFDLLTLKVVSESRVRCATSVPILVFLGLSVFDLGPMYATDVRQTSDVRQTQTDRRQTKASLNVPPIRGGGIIIGNSSLVYYAKCDLHKTCINDYIFREKVVRGMRRL